jgi:very-short-patch-repair endonuclease
MEPKQRARALGRDMTDAERRLWFAVRDRRLRGWRVRRQVPIGTFMVDVPCKEAGLIVEVDGGQHADSPHDRRRDACLRRAGYRIVRVWNNDVLTNPDGALEHILAALDEPR